MIVLETERLVLRPFTRDDRDALAALYADLEVTRYIGDGSTLGPERIEHMLNCAITDHERTWSDETLARLPQLRLSVERDAPFSLWAAVHKPDGRIIGRCGLLAWDLDGRKEVEVGYILAKSHWGRGLATEAARASRDHAFARLGVDHVISVIHRDNAGSKRVAVKNGMRHDHNSVVKDVPVGVYAIERPEWEKLR